jgi:hypothetical protein
MLYNNLQNKSKNLQLLKTLGSEIYCHYTSAKSFTASISIICYGFA